MPQGLKRFLKKIQGAEESVKKRYLLVFSAIAMIIVVGLWVLCLKGVSTAAVAEKNRISIQKIFSSVFRWNKDLIFKIREGRVINIER